MDRLQELSPLPMKITWHENKTSYLSVRKSLGSLHLRLHRLFYNAPTPVLEAIVRFAVKRDREARGVIKQMAHLYFLGQTVEPKPLSPVGGVYHLQEIFDRMLFLVPISNVTIGWGKWTRASRFRSMTFGTYNQHTRQIRIHPLLDDAQVPLYFLEFIVYHEMLHALCPSEIDGMGRCSIHTRQFKAKERQFPQFKAAKEWEKKSLTFFRRRVHGRA